MNTASGAAGHRSQHVSRKASSNYEYDDESSHGGDNES